MSSEYTLLVTLLPVLNIISVIASVFLIFSYIRLPALRKFPAFWVAIIAFPEAIRSFADTFVISQDFRDSLCVNPVTAAEPCKFLFLFIYQVRIRKGVHVFLRCQ